MSKRIRPHFISIGAPHCGAGLLMQLLATHPEIAGNIPSLQFFDTDAFTKKGLAWYESQFVAYHPLITGECTTSYLSSPVAAGRIVKNFSETKLIVVLRHPIKRAIAHYEQYAASPKVRKTSCRDFIATNASAQKLGFYGQHLERYFEYYSPLQIHVVIYEEFASDPLKVINEVFQFLGVNKDFLPPQLRPYLPPPEEPRYKSLAYRIKKLSKRLYRMVIKPKKPNLMLPEYDLRRYFSKADLELLEEMYQKDALILSRLLHRNMAEFWQLGKEG